MWDTLQLPCWPTLKSRVAPKVPYSLTPRIRDIKGEAGYKAYQFTGHSFRISDSMTAAQVGLEDSMIQALGRWHGKAFLAYI